jgi:hypothetical protein
MLHGALGASLSVDELTLYIYIYIYIYVCVCVCVCVCAHNTHASFDTDGFRLEGTVGFSLCVILFY